MNQEEIATKICRDCQHSYRIPGFLWPQCGLEKDEEELCPLRQHLDDDEA